MPKKKRNTHKRACQRRHLEEALRHTPLKELNHMLYGLGCSCKAYASCGVRLAMGYEWDGGYKLAHIVLSKEDPMGNNQQIVMRLSPSDVVDVMDTCRSIIAKMTEH